MQAVLAGDSNKIIQEASKHLPVSCKYAPAAGALSCGATDSARRAALVGVRHVSRLCHVLLLLLLPLLVRLQDQAKGKEDFSCGAYSGDEQQTEAVLVRAGCGCGCGCPCVLPQVSCVCCVCCVLRKCVQGSRTSCVVAHWTAALCWTPQHHTPGGRQLQRALHEVRQPRVRQRRHVRAHGRPTHGRGERRTLDLAPGARAACSCRCCCPWLLQHRNAAPRPWTGALHVRA
jgi:hypothetical protein